MSARRRKRSVVRAVRITEDQECSLRHQAEAESVSVGTLVAQIIEKHLEWDCVAEKYGMVTVTPSIIQGFINTISESNLREVGAAAGRHLKERTMFWYKQVSAETLLAMVERSCRYGHLARFDFHILGENRVIALRHDWGTNWSIFLEEWLREALVTALKVNPQAHHTESSVDITYKVPGKEADTIRLEADSPSDLGAVVAH